MPSAPSHSRLHYAGRAISIGTMALALIVSLLVVHQVNTKPRTDDAEVFANFIGSARVITRRDAGRSVADNQLVTAGDPLFDIDARPYAYALAHAQSDQVALKGEIGDERRIIAGKSSGVDV